MRYKAPNDAIPPHLTITSPRNGTPVQAGSTVAITAAATDNTAVARVEFLINGASVCTVPTAPYVCSWAVPNQPAATFLIVARAYDLTGNLSSQSVIVHAH